MIKLWIRQLKRTIPMTALLVVVFLGLWMPTSAQAATKFCTEYGGVIDGNDPLFAGGAPVQITIDDTCTFQNWPLTNQLNTTINFQTNDPSIYLVVFDNVWYDGNLACSNIPHKLWVVNSEEGSFSGTCQNIMIPAETIAKESPSATATIGVPFTYTLTLPSMNYPVGAPSPNDLGSIEFADDLNATGVDLTFVPGTLNAYDKGTGTPVPVTYLSANSDTYLHLGLPNINSGQQVVVEIDAILSDTPANVPGTQFVNTVTWQFSRWIDLDEDGFQDANEYFSPLPGESGISAPKTIVAPNLVVDKSTTATALNVNDNALYTIDVQNAGGGDAWNASIRDLIPVGMCDYDPTTSLSVDLIDSDGMTVVKTLAPDSDYNASYSICQLDLTLTDAAGPIGPDQHLEITYSSQLDISFTNDGATLTNVAGAVQWYSGDSSYANRRQFDRPLTDGTPGNPDDHQDSETVTAALHGYYFEKRVANLTSQASPATTAAPGDTLRYRLRVFNVDQTIDNVSISDVLDPAVFDTATLSNVTVTTAAGYSAITDFNAVTGLLQIYGAPDLNVDVYGELVVSFDITLWGGLADGTTVSNQATINAAGGFVSPSDDPYVNGVASPDIDNDEDPTELLIETPGPLSKANNQPTAMIGEQFSYTITVPAVASAAPLYDVQIMDDLPLNLRFVSAQAAGGSWIISNSGNVNALILEDTVTGIDIPAYGQAVIEVTVELLNDVANQSGTTFVNSASYTYNRANSIDSTKLSGGSGSTADMAVVEADLAVVKAVQFITPVGKLPTDPATVGDVLEYTISVDNNGDATAFDVSVVDTLPANVALVAGSATAAINGAAVTGFVVDPTTLSGTTQAWGRENGDGSIDLPVGETLLLIYRVTVVDATSASAFTNSAYVNWTSLNDAKGSERTGAGCPVVTSPNDYCAGPADVVVFTEDNTSMDKHVFADSYAETPPSTGDPVVRVGDTVTFDLTLNLQEYTTYNVAIEDQLPAGLALESFSVIAGGSFSYTPGLQPTPGATGTLRWEFGDIVNAPSGDATPLDPLTIRYVALVLTDAPPTGVDVVTSLLRDNLAQLSYTGGDPTLFPGRLTAKETIEVRQPRMSAISKVDLGSGRSGNGTADDPYQVNLATDTMQFELTSCNTGLAPAYNVQISDLFASELDETSLSAPLVSVGGSVLTPGSAYSYTPPAGRGGSMGFALAIPVNPGECVAIGYTVDFHTDISAPATWSNEARLTEYASLPAAGRIYTSNDLDQVFMTNQFSVEPLTKVLMAPASGEATIGEQAVYQLTVPGAPVNAALDNVTVSDTLHDSLAFIDASATLDGAPIFITTVQSGQDLGWSIPTIPAGQQAIITLTVRVANNDFANAGMSMVNSAAYTFDTIPPGSTTDGISAPLSIVEPDITIAKTVSNISHPGLGPSAGDTLRYSLTFTSGGGSAGDAYSDAFDLRIEDTLSLGMAYQSGTANVDGSGNTIADPTLSGDGSITSQTLTWDITDATADIDVPEGTLITVSYDVLVLDSVVAGQVLSNGAGVWWTGLDGTSGDKRTGSGTPSCNDYVDGPVSTALIVGDNNSLAKAIIADSYVDVLSTADDKIVRIGDTATYRLTVNLGEGTTRSVTLQDVLPSGMAYDGLVGITPASGSGPFTYSLISGPAAGATGTLSWDLGDVVNTPSGDGTPVDALVIEYQALVQPDAGIASDPATALTNTATLGYLDAGGSQVINSTRLVASDTLSVRQPVLSPVVKFGNGAANTAATPLDVSVAVDTVQFHLESCNSTGQAPAYGVQISDVLASQLDETSLSAPQVAIGGTPLSLGVDYSYTPPAGRGGSLNFVLNAPVGPGECVTIDYAVGFHTDFGPNQLWNNSAIVVAYESLPAGAGQVYTPVEVAQFYMTNVVSVEPLVKSLQSPTSGEATIGEQATYQITVPGTPVSAALDNVVVSDTLHDALAFVGATATLNGAPFAITTVQFGQDLSWSIPSIPAGQQAVIALNVRVANNDLANAGTSVVNSATYSYDALPPSETAEGSSAPLTIVEPTVTIAKRVDLESPPVAGDILTYTVDLIAAGAYAFDAVLDDSLSLGLGYVAGSARLEGVANEPAVSGDGVATPQTLVWSGGIDIPSGAIVSISYEVRVLDTVVAGQPLSNSAGVSWTSLTGASANERTGSGTPAYNDYFAGPVTTSLTIATPDLTLLKKVDKPVANPGDRLRYTLTIENPTAIRLANFTMVDDIEAENVTPRFQAGSLGNVVVPAGASYLVSGTTLTVSDLNIAPNGSLTVQFEAVLSTALPGASVVFNQALLTGPWPTPIRSDDPNLPGSDDPTQTIIPANGVVYDAATHTPLSGVTLTMLRASTSAPLPASCFIDAAQQNQTTLGDGTYKFDLMFDPTGCPAGEDYLIAVTATPAGYVAEPSLLEAPLSDASTAAYPAPLCPNDAIAATGICEADVSATVPEGTPSYYLHLNFDATANQIYNNHIPVDQKIEEKISIFKATPRVNVTRGQIVPYTIRVKNTLRSALPLLGVVDTLPPGFTYASGSSRYDGVKLEPVVNGGQLRWDNLDIGYNREHTIELLLIVGGGVSEGKFVNRAQVIDSTSDAPVSEIAMATVRVVADPDFDCTDVIGKVFDDRDLDGMQQSGEFGIAGVRVVTARGLTAATDPSGRFHITCATIPDAERGSNFILKLDDRTLPTGYRVISENPRVQRATRGKALRFSFAAALHRIVSIDVAAGVFEVEGDKLREVWQPRIDQLIEVLREQPSILRISYLADDEEMSLVEARREALRDLVEEAWRNQEEELYRLTVETSVFWRRGKPLSP